MFPVSHNIEAFSGTNGEHRLRCESNRVATNAYLPMNTWSLLHTQLRFIEDTGYESNFHAHYGDEPSPSSVPGLT